MSGTNCSYTDSNGIYTQLLCSTAQPYCCTSAGSHSCSASTCDASSTDSAQNFPAIIFWAILGGLLLLGAVAMLIVYIVCHVRKPTGCMSNGPVDELFEETVEQEVHTVTSQTQSSSKEMTSPVIVRREMFRKVTTRQRSRNNLFQPSDTVKISVASSSNCGNADTSSSERSDSNCDVRRLVTPSSSGKGKTETSALSPRGVITTMPNIG